MMVEMLMMVNSGNDDGEVPKLSAMQAVGMQQDHGPVQIGSNFPCPSKGEPNIPVFSARCPVDPAT